MTTVKLKPVDKVLMRVAYYAEDLADLTRSKLCHKVYRAIVNHMFDKYVPVSIRASGNMHAYLSSKTIRY